MKPHYCYRRRLLAVPAMVKPPEVCRTNQRPCHFKFTFTKMFFFFLSLIFNITVDFYLNLGDRILFQILQNVSRLRYPLFIYLHILA